MVLIIGILATLAIPAYLGYQARSRQGEVLTNLGGIYVAETAFYGDRHRFSGFAEIGFVLAGSTNRYTYRAEKTDSTGAGTGVIESINALVGPIMPENMVVQARSTSTSFTATGTANLDNDATADEWHVSDLAPGLGVQDTNDISR